ncbi:hypothetical protein [Kaistella rhinocerotis]|jgi:hypothetical protein|uniref:hypothetical protein n=1 Tax=Kaistella rhinocerotis TaxID=3026437 RepID=UPI00255553A9|nr:hypothetical protein [Kaistella sp. Ran72]
MDNFNELHDVWKQAKTPAPNRKNNLSQIKTNKMKLKQKEIKHASVLIFTGIFILGLMLSFDGKLQTLPIMSAMIIISLACFLQAAVMFFNARKISQIDDSNTPAVHLQQWLDFREFQKKQRRWNMPVYYILLSVSLAVYLYELLKAVEFWKMALAFVLTYSWMLIAYFYFGKRELKKQDAKMDGIIAELKELETQFQ